MKIGFIGMGNLASALVRGCAQSSFFKQHEFCAYDVYTPSLDAVKPLGVTAVSDADTLIRTCGTVILAVKPKDIPALLRENQAAFAAADPFLVSVAAGTPLASITDLLGFEARAARIMPNINASVGGAATAVFCNSLVKAEEKETLLDFCRSFGGAYEMDEAMFAIFGVIGGCSPAFTYLYIDALARAAVKFGMKKELALEIAAQTVKGSAQQVLASDRHPYELVDRVCSPGGTTIEGVTALSECGFEHAVHSAVEAAYQKDRNMSNKKN